MPLEPLALTSDAASLKSGPCVSSLPCSHCAALTSPIDICNYVINYSDATPASVVVCLIALCDYNLERSVMTLPRKSRAASAPTARVSLPPIFHLPLLPPTHLAANLPPTHLSTRITHALYATLWSGRRRRTQRGLQPV